ncbi:MAG: hypothetical protein VX589_17260 [Myxococcota bacterium]|nr:hypothetical protein [Myxococcota bacterium]
MSEIDDETQDPQSAQAQLGEAQPVEDLGEDDEQPVPYSSIAGKPVSGKIVVISLILIVVGVVWGANVWLSPAQQKLNAVYRKQKRLDTCMASMKSNRMLSAKAKEDVCKRQAAKRRADAVNRKAAPPKDGLQIPPQKVNAQPPIAPK